jgi:V8-like Glu-specific endopeptidase
MQYLKIDSAKRQNPGSTTPGQFTLQCQATMTGRYALKALYCSVDYENINGHNSKIYFREGGIDKVATLTTGYYTISSLLTEIKSAMDTASGGTNTFTVTRSTLPQRLVISGTSAFELTFGTNTANSSAEILGYPAADTSSATSHTATNIINLASIRSLNFDFNGFSSVSDTTGRSYSLVIPITTNTPGVQYYEPTETFPQVINFDIPTRNLSISVRDDDHNVIPLQSDWFMIIQKC